MTSIARVRTEGSENKVKTPVGVFIQAKQGKLQPESTLLTPEYVPYQKICFDEVHTNYPKEGGPFALRMSSTEFKNAGVWRGYNYSAGTNNDYWYTLAWSGICVEPASYYGSGSLPSDPTNETASFGAEAWAKMKPNLSKVSMGQFIYELRSMSGLLFRRLDTLRNAGSNYLAVEFGWKPFLRDLRTFWSSLRRLDQQLDRLRKENGKWIRRRRTLVETSESGVVPDPTHKLVNVTSYVDNPKTWVEWKRTTKVWCVGRFRYYIPGLDDTSYKGTIEAISHIYGVRLTPSLVYELLPWSWLVDWFSNLGHIVNNYNAQLDENLVAKYAYVMRETEVVTTRKGTGVARYRTTRIPAVYNSEAFECSVTTTSRTKSRVAASPFGFHLSLPDFSVWQLSILAALGLSSLKRL